MALHPYTADDLLNLSSPAADAHTLHDKANCWTSQPYITRRCTALTTSWQAMLYEARGRTQEYTSVVAVSCVLMTSSHYESA